MTRSYGIVPILLLAIAGCGGHHHAGSSTTTGPSANAFIGSWAGTFSESGAGTLPTRSSGTLSVTIARKAPTDLGVTIAGTVQDSNLGTGTVGGGIADLSNPAAGSGINFVFGDETKFYVGRPTLDARGHIVGPLYLDLGDGHPAAAFDLAPVAAAQNKE